MKAEHRKELQTNVLADRMGRFMENVRHKPKGTTVLVCILIVVVLIAVVIWVFWYFTQARTQSELWLKLNSGGKQTIDSIIKEYPNYEQAKIGRFQVAWSYLWDFDINHENGVFYGGIANLKTAGTPELALAAIELAAKQYQELAEETQDNPMLRAEAMYNLAIAQESLSIKKIDQLKSAKSTLNKLVSDEKLKNTVHGKLATKRLEVYNNEDSYNQMRDFYEKFGEQAELQKK